MDAQDRMGPGSGAAASVVAVFETDEQARMGFDALRDEGVPDDSITVVGSGETDPDETFAAPDSPTATGAGRGALWGGVAGAAVAVLIPGGGVVLASGIFAAAAVGATTGAGLGILSEVGVPAASVQDYEEDLADGRYLVVVSGSPEEVTRAHAVLDMTDTEELDFYG